MQINYSLEDIESVFDSKTFQRGENFFINKRVLSVIRNRGGDVFFSKVRGSGSKQYTLNVSLADDDSAEPFFYSSCSCPVGAYCKHAAATLLAILQEYKPEALIKGSKISKDNGQLNQWLGLVKHAIKGESNTAANQYPKNVKNRLLYVLNLSQYSNASVLHVSFLNARQLANGGFGKATHYDPARIVHYDRASYITEADEEILRKLYARNLLESIAEDKLAGKDSGDLLAMMVATGRCYWEDKNGNQLQKGNDLPGKFSWQMDEIGFQKLALVIEGRPVAIILPTEPPYYFDLSNHQCGVIKTQETPELTDVLLKSPWVEQDKVYDVFEKLTDLNVKLPQPEKVTVVMEKESKPRPILTLKSYVGEDAFGHKDSPEPVATLQFEYNGQLIFSQDQSELITRKQDNVLIQSKRAWAAESVYLDTFVAFGFEPLREIDTYNINVPENYFGIMDWEDVDAYQLWMDFLVGGVEALKAEGWEINTDQDFPMQLSAIESWEMKIDESIDNQWFDLALGITVDGEKIDLLNLILHMLRRDPELLIQPGNTDEQPKNLLVNMPDGKLVPVPLARLRKIVDVLVDLHVAKNDVPGPLTIPQWRAAEIVELQSEGIVWNGSKKLKTIAEKLSKFDSINPVKPSKAFKATLREYQLAGLAWLQFLREYDFNGILADDMGLGKTVQALAHICLEKESKRLKKPVLVVAPTSLMFNWRHEAEQFAPHLRVLTLHGPDRKQRFSSIAEFDVVLTTYPLLGRDDKVLLEQEWHMVILDEAQTIKNPKAKATKIACQLKANHRLCLTGTPMENHLGELWSIFNFLMPGLLGDERQFRQLFRTPIEKHGDTERSQRLAKRLAPFMLRRKKDEVVKELPAKTEMIRTVPVEGVQRDLYESVRVSMQKKVRDAIGNLGMGKSHIIVLDALLKLRQICCDPRLLKSAQVKNKTNSAKLDLLMELLPELLEEGRKILLFSQFTSMLSLIEKELNAKKISYAKLTGNTKNREKPISQFQNGDVSLFLISLKAGGTGLNLTAADAVIHYDPWWNPAVEAQATDRAHRLGQEKPVFVYKLLTENTVESRIQQMQESKRQLAEGLFESAGKGKLPGAKDLEVLFEPLV